MGYTHVYNLPEVNKLDNDKFQKFVEDVQKLYDNLPKKTKSGGGYYEDEKLEIAGGLGEGNPVFNKRQVSFNGKGDLMHETFAVYKDTTTEGEMNAYRGYQFCKTARKPYDLLVCAALLSLEHHFGRRTVKLKTDGTHEDWKPAITLYEKTLRKAGKSFITALKKKGE